MHTSEPMRHSISRQGSRTHLARLAVGAATVLTLLVWGPVHCHATDLAASPITIERTTRPSNPTSGAPDLDAARLQTQLRAATDFGAMNGAQVSIAFMDRASGIRATNGNVEPIETASVSKLFIADDILFREYQGEFDLSENDVALIDVMLRSSNDVAAEELWNRFGRNSIVDRIASRYVLPSTAARAGDEWWRTRTTMADVVTYYSKLIDGAGGLETTRSESILFDLRSFTATGSDGYYQRFGLPDALPAEGSIAVKQGWMCCIDGDWIHLSTGVAGPGDRYIVAISSREAVDTYGGGSVGADHARRTVTGTATALFPSGRIDLS